MVIHSFQAGGPGDGKKTRRVDQEMRRGPSRQTKRWVKDHLDQACGPGDRKRARRVEQEMEIGPDRWTRRWEEDQAGRPGDGKKTRWMDQ